MIVREQEHPVERIMDNAFTQIRTIEEGGRAYLCRL